MKNKNIGIIIGIIVLILALVYIFFNTNNKETNTFKTINGRILNTIEEYKQIINTDIETSEYSSYSIKEFYKILTKDIGTSKTKLEYSLYRSEVTKDLEVYLLTNNTNNYIDQIRYRVNLNSNDVEFEGYLLGATMRLLYNKPTAEELNTFYSKLGINKPIEGMNNTYEFNNNIYRAIVKDNYLTIYLTGENVTYFEEKYTEITPENEKDKNELPSTDNKESIISVDYYLNNSDGKDFFENVLCSVTGITSTNTEQNENEIVYKGSNTKYYIKVITNLDNQIKFVDMNANTKEDSTNFFMASTRLHYDGENAKELTDYIIKSLQEDYSIIYIGNAKFKLTPTYNGKILEITASK